MGIGTKPRSDGRLLPAHRSRRRRPREEHRRGRRALYERARTALVAQLRGVTPPLNESEITRERLALEEAIRKVEAEAARRAVEPPRADCRALRPDHRRASAPRAEPPRPARASAERLPRRGRRATAPCGRRRRATPAAPPPAAPRATRRRGGPAASAAAPPPSAAAEAMRDQAAAASRAKPMRRRQRTRGAGDGERRSLPMPASRISATSSPRRTLGERAGARNARHA